MKPINLSTQIKGKLNFRKSGIYNKFPSCRDRMDIGEIRQGWVSEDPFPVRVWTQRHEKKIVLPHVEGRSGWDCNSLSVQLHTHTKQQAKL